MREFTCPNDGKGKNNGIKYIGKNWFYWHWSHGEKYGFKFNESGLSNLRLYPDERKSGGAADRRGNLGGNGKRACSAC